MRRHGGIHTKNRVALGFARLLNGGVKNNHAIRRQTFVHFLAFYARLPALFPGIGFFSSGAGFSSVVCVFPI